MRLIRPLLMAGTALSLMTAGAVAGPAQPVQPFQMAQAASSQAEIDAARQAVEAAAAALQQAEASGQGVEQARQALEQAMARLQMLQAASGAQPTPPAPPADLGDLPAPPDGAPPAPGELPEPPPAAAEQPPAAPEPPAAATEEPAQPEAPAAPPAAATETPPQPEAPEAPPAAAAEPPAAPAEPPAAATEPPAQPEAPAAPPAAATEPPAQPEAPAAPPAAATETPAQPEAPASPPAAATETPAQPEAPAAPPSAAGLPTPPAGAPPAPGDLPAPSELVAPNAPPPSIVTPDGAPAGNVAATPPPPTLPDSASIGEGQSLETTGGRVITKEGGQLRIQHNDTDRFRLGGGTVDVQQLQGGQTLTTVTRPNGVAVVTLRDANGNVLRRTRRLPDGREVVLIDNTRVPPPPPGAPPVPDFSQTMPPLRLSIPQQDYVVESQGASEQRLQQALMAPPVEAVERPYTLDEIRYNERLRDKVRRVDIDTVTFDSGQATLTQDQAAKLGAIGRALWAVIQQNPNEVYLLEGHTDAVGGDTFNLALSDQRADSVAQILTYYYGIPPENLVTQGYGEAYLKVPTTEAERQNRRVTVRRITPLLNAGQ